MKIVIKERCKAVYIHNPFQRGSGCAHEGHMDFDGCRRTLVDPPSYLALVLHCWTLILLRARHLSTWLDAGRARPEQVRIHLARTLGTPHFIATSSQTVAWTQI